MAKNMRSFPKTVLPACAVSKNIPPVGRHVFEKQREGAPDLRPRKPRPTTATSYLQRMTGVCGRSTYPPGFGVRQLTIRYQIYIASSFGGPGPKHRVEIRFRGAWAWEVPAAAQQQGSDPCQTHGKRPLNPIFVACMYSGPWNRVG